MSPRTRIQAARRPACTVIHVSGEIDVSCADDLEAQLVEAAEDAVAVVLDLTGVSFIDSAGTRAVAHVVAAGTHQTRLVAPAGTVRRVLEVTGMEAVAPIDATVADAEAALG
jgi:anti-anti-sigma factor